MKKIIVSILSLLFSYQLSYGQVNNNDWAQFGRYKTSNENIKVKPLAVFMGDSTTDGWDDADGDFFYKNNFVCRGISGQTTSEMLVRFRQDVIDLYPQYVVILAGINDIAQNNGFITPENIVGNIISMCELAKLHNIEPVICSITPASEFIWRKEIKDVANKVINVNNMLKSYAEKNKIKYVDYHSAIKDNNNGLPACFSKDGVHPNKECYEIMESIIIKVLI